MIATLPLIFTDDGSFEGFDNSPRIFYNNGEVDTGITYHIPAQNDLSSENQPEFLQFSHLSTIPTQVTIPPASTDTIDFYFGSYGYIMPIGVVAVDNLYSLYWQPYFNELYNPDTRTMTLKVNLTPADINTIMEYLRGYTVKPGRVTVTGEVLFTDGTNEVLANQLQCEAYGYTYNNASGTCSAYRVNTNLPINVSNINNRINGAGNTTELGTNNVQINGTNNTTKGFNNNCLLNGSDNEIGNEVNNSLVAGSENEISTEVIVSLF